MISTKTIEFAIDHADFMNEAVKRIIENRGYLFREMEKIKEVKLVPSKTNFILFEVENPRKIYEELIKRGILIRYFEGKKYLRVSVGTYENCVKFISDLKEILNVR